MADATASAEIVFHYLKGQDFRNVHVDGVIGGFTPRGLVHLACYVERPAIPQTIRATVDDRGVLSEPTDVVTRGGIIRELENDLFMDVQTAFALHKWLGELLRNVPATPEKTDVL